MRSYLEPETHAIFSKLAKLGRYAVTGSLAARTCTRRLAMLYVEIAMWQPRRSNSFHDSGQCVAA